MSLPDDVFLESSAFEIKFPEVPPFTPKFRELVDSMENRGTQWKRIVDLGVNQKTVAVFRTKEDYLYYLENNKFRAPDLR